MASAIKLLFGFSNRFVGFSEKDGNWGQFLPLVFGVWDASFKVLGQGLMVTARDRLVPGVCFTTLH